jgi:nucleoside 2-deoxyribosyltransferase
MKMQNDLIYLASGIFNINTNIYNAYLAKQLEARGYNCFLPQRDGFEVANYFIFLEAAREYFSEEEASIISHYVPYYLDLGYFMSRSIATVANIDEPVDLGMVVEIAYARFCNIPVIGLRTDLRSPLGNATDVIGINPFPVEQCDCYIKADTPTGGYDEIIEATNVIIDKIEEKLREWIARKKSNMTENDNPIIKDIIKGSDILFTDLDMNEIHTKESMKEIAERFIENKKFFLANAPELVSIKA